MTYADFLARKALLGLGQARRPFGAYPRIFTTTPAGAGIERTA